MRFWILLTAFVMVAAIREKATVIEPRPVKVMMPKCGSELSSFGTVRRGTATKTSTKPTFAGLPAVKKTLPRGRMGRRPTNPQVPRDVSDIPSLFDVATIQPRRARMRMTNPYVPRDVSDCFTKFQELTRNSAFSPEKIILGHPSSMTPDVFCEQQKKFSAVLSSACHLPAPDSDKGAVFAATAIANMMHFVCDKSSLKVIQDRDGKCYNTVKTVTSACFTKQGLSTLTSGIVEFPSDLIIMMMKKSHNSTAICNTKLCIRSEMQKGPCPAHQHKTILNPLDSLISVCPTETIETTTTIPPASTTPIPPPYTTTTVPTRSTDYSVRPFTDKDGRETRPDTGCVEWRNVGRSLGSACDDAADYMCSQRIPPTDAANCWAVKDDSPCCKKVKVIKGRYSLSECLSDCTRDPTVCRERHPATKAAKCSVRPSGAHGTTCCVAEFIYT